MAVSIGKVRNGGYTRHLTDSEKSGAAEYYKGEDVPSQWVGRGAEMQGLRGEVRDDDLRDQLAGRLTDSTGARDLSEENSRSRTEGFDVTVSAPKSVSIEALARENGDVLQAHREANTAVLNRIEELARTEFRKDGQKQTEKTENITVASYEHHGSVSGDPHLHTHNAVMNTTFDSDGKARALDARQIYGNVEELRRTYDEALEKALNDRGFATYRDDKGHTQLEGYSKEGMREFSTRSEQIERKLDETGRDAASARERELARQETRRGQSHEPKSREETMAAWQEKLEQTRGAGPAQKAEPGAKRQEQQREQRRENSREEFRDAKWVVNAEKDARAKIDGGAYTSEAHREQLERRIEQAESLRARDPGLYERAENAAQRMGVRDPDEQRQRSDRERFDQKIEASEADGKKEFANAARTVNDMKDAQAKLDGGRYNSPEHKADLEKRVEAGEKLREQDPKLFSRAEKSVDRRGVEDADARADRQTIGADGKKEFANAARTVNDMKDAQAKLDGGRYNSPEHKADLEKRVEAGEKLREQDPKLFSRAEKSVDRRGVEDADARADRQTIDDADLAARALKSDAGLALGVGRKELSAADKKGMETAFNSRGDKFYRDESGNVYADKLQGKREPKETYFKTEKGGAGGEKDYMMNAKGEVFVRASGSAGGAQRAADSPQSEGRGSLANVGGRMTQDSVRTKWERANEADTARIQKEAHAARKEFYTNQIAALNDLRNDIERATTAFAERPQDMAKALDSMLKSGKDVDAPGAQEQAALQRFDERLSQAVRQESVSLEAALGAMRAAEENETANSKAALSRSEDSSRGTEATFVAGVAKDTVGTAGTVAEAVASEAKASSPQEAEKAVQEARERAQIERQRTQVEDGQQEAARQQATVEDAGKAKGAGGDPERVRAGEEQQREAGRQAAQEQKGQDHYTRREVDRAIHERREQQAQEGRTATSSGGESAEAKAAPREADSARLEDLREQAERLAESVIRREGARGANAERAAGFDAQRTSVEELAQFIEKYGTPAQKEAAREELSKREQYQKDLERRENREKADRQAHERTYGRLD